MSKDRYEDSAEFTAELSELQSLGESIEKILKQPRFAQWIKLTNQNFDTACDAQYQQVQTEIERFNDALDNLSNELCNLG